MNQLNMNMNNQLDNSQNNNMSRQMNPNIQEQMLQMLILQQQNYNNNGMINRNNKNINLNNIYRSWNGNQ